MCAPSASPRRMAHRSGLTPSFASLTKPVAAAAAMMLVDEGLLHLDDTVERWLPELGHRRVLRRVESPIDDTEPARRPITVRDVLTYRMGCGALLRKPDSTPKR